MTTAIALRTTELALPETTTSSNGLIEELQPHPLILRFQDIKAVLIIITMLLLTHMSYSILAIISTQWERVDMFMSKKAINLNDAPKGNYQYMLTIQTNWRLGSGRCR